MRQPSTTRAPLPLCALVPLVLLVPALAWAKPYQAGQRTTWKPKSQADYRRSCLSNPSLPGCRNSAWQYRRSTNHQRYMLRNSHRGYQADLAVRERLDAHRRMQHHLQQKQHAGAHAARGASLRMSGVRDAWARLRHRMLHFARHITAVTGGFGEHVRGADPDGKSRWTVEHRARMRKVVGRRGSITPKRNKQRQRKRRGRSPRAPTGGKR